MNARGAMPQPADTVTRFNDRAHDYVRCRPSYPAAAIDAVLDGLGSADRLTIADVGAGTGISARLLGDRGARVLAIEPGEAMRRAAASHPNVFWTGARAEATGIRADSCDLVLCAQSFHWFGTPAVVDELARILPSGGRLALVWNRRSTRDPFTLGYRRAILDAGGDHAIERMRFDPGVVAGDGRFSAPERLAFPNAQRLDLDGLIGRAHSASYVPKEGRDGARLLDHLRALHAEYADAHGLVTLVYETEVYRAAKI